MALSTTITLTDPEGFKQKALYWANHFGVVCLLDNNHYPHGKYHTKDWVLAIDATDELCNPLKPFEELKTFHAKQGDDIFGFFSYEANNSEPAGKSKPDTIGFPGSYFFSPRYILEIKGNKLTVNRNLPETSHLLEHIEKVPIPQSHGHRIQLKARTSKQNYLQNVQHIKGHIARGDYYELNYCTELYAEQAIIQPVETFLALNESAKAPFSCFFKLEHKYLLCASPERFLKKEGPKLISQPIKGTIRKGNTVEENEALKKQLQNDPKERAENTMIVDLVRNDLSRSSKDGSVVVEELCAIYEFNAVNQMVSTITSEIKEGEHFADAIKNAFPMGSMTGAPKTEVMKNIDQYEDFKRGLYSGAVGYITPGGDFDLNVVIRSILYNQPDKYLSIRTGGAITHHSIPQNEYEETLLKAKGLMDVLGAELSE